ASLERAIDAPLDCDRRFAHHLRHFGDDEELGAIEHPFLAKRKALRFRQKREALEDIGNFVDGAAAHLVGVVLEESFTVLMIVDLAIAEETEEAFDFLVRDGAAQADAID